LALAVKTRARLQAIVRDVQADQPNNVQKFIDAVHALSDDPGPANLQRYLAVSRELEESPRPRESAAQEVRARPRDRGRRPARAEAAKADA
jgi:hypothetical protein